MFRVARHGSTALLSAALWLAASELAAQPLLVNPSFEDDGTGVAAPAGWQSEGSTDADFTEFGGNLGDWRLSHYSANAYSVQTTQEVAVDKGSWYTLRAFVRRSTGDNQAALELDCGGSPARVAIPVAWPSQWLDIAVSARARRQSCRIALSTEAGAGEWTNFDDVALSAGRVGLTVVGADVSSLTKSEDFGGVYFSDRPGRQHRGHRGSQSALRILKEHGATHIRARVWVDPADGYHDLAEVTQLARRARRAGLKLLVDLHYSDTWADPAHQAKPGAWAGYTFEQLEAAVYDHTYAVCSSVRDAAEAPDMVQLGNELNAGMLWPDGHTYDPPNWDNLARLLQAGHAAIEDCSDETKVVLHLANGGDNGLYQWWFDNITARGVDFDIIGASYYGYWHGSLGDLQYNLNDVAQRYDKDVLVVETAYPFTLDDEGGFTNIIGLPDQLVDGYPATPEGQASNLRDVLSIVRSVPGGHGLGALYWDATWIEVPGNGWDPTDPSSGNNWENQALFDFDSRALPAMSEFSAAGLLQCRAEHDPRH